MYRQIITPSQTQFVIDFPPEFIGKEVELIAFTLEEADVNSKGNVEELKREAFEFLKNSSKVDLSNFKFDRGEENER